jgi:putative ABC transport system permease protein
MNNIFFYIRFLLISSFEDLKRNKLRTILTSLGIFIGIASVVLLISLGLGLKKYIADMFKSLGSNLVMVMPGKMTGSAGANAGMMESKFEDKDIELIKKVKNVYQIAPVLVKYAKLEANGVTAVYETIGSTPEIFKMMNFEIDTGRLYDKADNDKRSKVIVVGSKTAEKLFGDSPNATNKMVKMDEMSYKIIGVLKSKGGGGIGGASMDEHVFVPNKSGYIFPSTKKYWGIYVSTTEDSYVAQVKIDMQKVLLKNYKEEEFSVTDNKEMLSMVTSIFDMLNIVLIAVATISLIVGGVGVMNIMYVSVVERVKEIGIRRAVGALDHDILLLFLLESIIVSLLGGGGALLFVFIIVTIIQPYFPAYIDLNSIFLAFGVSIGIGLFFGVFPARKASHLTPIEAIRSE